MDLKEVVLDCLTDNKEGMKHLITWFLNEVMQEEADERMEKDQRTTIIH
jgi:hypothetical protein